MTTYTIKELAEELGTSKTTIKNLYSKLGIEPSKETRKNQAVVVLTSSEAEQIKRKYKASHKADHKNNKVSSPTEKEEVQSCGYNLEVEFLRKLVNTLQEELQTEREHNRQLQDKLVENLSIINKNQLATSQNALIDKASEIMENQEPTKKHWFDRFKK